MRQSTLKFNSSASPEYAKGSSSPEPEPRSSPKSTSKRKKRLPVQKAFNHGRKEVDQAGSGGEEISDSEEEITLSAVRRKRGSSEGEDSQDDSEGEQEEDEQDEDSEAMMDLEASDDEEYQSGDSLDEDEGGNSRRKKDKKKKNKRAKERERELQQEMDEEEEEEEIRSPRKKKPKLFESDDEASLEEVKDEPVASTSRDMLKNLTVSPTRPNDPLRRKRAHAQFVGVVVPLSRKRFSASPSVGPSRGSRSPVKTKGKKETKKSRLEAINDSDSDSDPLPEPESLRKEREGKGSAKKVRSDGKKQKKKRKKEVVKRKLQQLTQGTKDQRSGDEATSGEDSSEGEFVVDDNEEIEADDWSESERERVFGRDEARRMRREEKRIREADKEALRQKRLAREKGKGKSKATIVESESEEEEEPVQSQKKKRKATGKVAKTPPKVKKRKRARIPSEEPDDLEILDEETVIPERLRGARSSVANKFEELRAARANRGTSSQQPVVVHSSGSESEPHRRRGSQSNKAKRKRSRREPESETSSEESSEESDGDAVDSDNFIVSDEEGDAENEEAQIELEKFREGFRAKAQGLKYFVKTYLNYLVHVIVCPEAHWLEDKDFKEAKDKVEGYLQGIISSSLSSAGWLPKFKHTVDTRPELVIVDLTETPPCDACAQGKTRRATLLGRFSGQKYDPKNLRPLDPSDDESEPSSSSSSDSASDSDSDGGEKDIFGRKVKGKKKDKRRSKDKVYEYNLGKYCAGRCEVYHLFQHWPYTTRQKMALKVAPLRDKSIKKAKRKPGMSTEEFKDKIKKERRAREKDASRVSAELDSKGIISDLTTTLVNELERACTNFSGQ